MLITCSLQTLSLWLLLLTLRTAFGRPYPMTTTLTIDSPDHDEMPCESVPATEEEAASAIDAWKSQAVVASRCYKNCGKVARCGLVICLSDARGECYSFVPSTAPKACKTLCLCLPLPH